jgi:anhydro-N-acetylmuramic acid kinase
MQDTQRSWRVLGLMSGTSMDGVDAAIIETDGHHSRPVGGAMAAFTDAERVQIESAVDAALSWQFEGPEPSPFAPISRLIAERYAALAQHLITAHGRIDFVGAHGQTVLHRAPVLRQKGATCQLLDAGLLAEALQMPVYFDFRRADVEAGGQGAPLAPVYHRALLQALGAERTGGVLNLGGVANLSFWNGGDDLIGFDTGPASMLMDRLCGQHGAGRFDPEGRGAAMGTVDGDALGRLLTHPYLEFPVPKSLDRHDFDLSAIAGLSLHDGLATLTEFSAITIADAIRTHGRGCERVIVVGGGVHNRYLMERIAALSLADIVSAAALGHSPDWLEAELMAFCAARAHRGLPITFPGTTGVAVPLTGGRRAVPSAWT